MCPFDKKHCDISLMEICHHCQRFTAHYADKLPRLGRIDRALLMEGLTVNYDKTYRFPRLTESEAVSRRRSLAKLEKHGFTIRYYHTAKIESSWTEVTRRIPRLTPLGRFIATSLISHIEAGKPIRWAAIRPLITVGADMEGMRIKAIETCKLKIEDSRAAASFLSAYSSSLSKDLLRKEIQKFEYYSSKLKSLQTLNVTPTQKIV